MRKIFAGILLLLGIAGLLIGWLGETVWAPDASHTANVSLDKPGAAVLVNPGVLYVGGEEGTLTATGSGKLTVITATPKDAAAYLDGYQHTAITGVPTWKTLKAEKRNPDGKPSFTGTVKSDLWIASTTASGPAKVDISKFAAEERNPQAPQPYRTIMIVSDDPTGEISSVQIEWPSHKKNSWVPFAYAAGAVCAVLGLILLLLSVSFGKDREEADDASGDAVSGRDDLNEHSDTEQRGEKDAYHDVPEHAPSHGRRRAALPDDAPTTVHEKAQENTER